MSRHRKKKIEKVRIEIGDKVYPAVSVDEIKEALKEINFRDRILYPAIDEKVKEVRWGNRDPNTLKVCAICEHYSSKAIFDVGSEGVCLKTDRWVSFADSCKKWKWDGIRIKNNLRR